jgi:hypothetical protein
MCIAAGKRSKTHTVLDCVFGSGVSLPPLIVNPCKRRVPDGMRVGAPADTMFMVSDSWIINKEIFLEWFK